MLTVHQEVIALRSDWRVIGSKAEEIPLKHFVLSAKVSKSSELAKLVVDIHLIFLQTSSALGFVTMHGHHTGCAHVYQVKSFVTTTSMF